MSAEYISQSTASGVRWIEFHRPPVNAFIRPMVEATRDAITAAAGDDSVRVIVLASAVDGYFSAGADLNEFRGMTSIEMRFAADDARLGQPEVQIAFIPPIATTQALVRLIGRPRTLRYLYGGRLVNASEAHAWGLVDELVDPAFLRSHVQDYAESLTEQSATALAAIRSTVTLGGGMTFADGMQLELETAAALADTPDFAEGIDAFLAKRKPQWDHN